MMALYAEPGGHVAKRPRMDFGGGSNAAAAAAVTAAAAHLQQAASPVSALHLAATTGHPAAAAAAHPAAASVSAAQAAAAAQHAAHQAHQQHTAAAAAAAAALPAAAAVSPPPPPATTLLSQHYIEQQLNRKPAEPEKPNHILLFTVLNPTYPITCEVLHTICAPVGGGVLRIVIFKKNGVQAMVEFDSVDSAKTAKESLHGCDIYSGCCTLKIEFAKPSKLNVYRNDADSWDYTNPNLGSGKRGAGGGGGGAGEDEEAGAQPVSQRPVLLKEPLAVAVNGGGGGSGAAGASVATTAAAAVNGVQLVRAAEAAATFENGFHSAAAAAGQQANGSMLSAGLDVLAATGAAGGAVTTTSPSAAAAAARAAAAAAAAGQTAAIMRGAAGAAGAPGASILTTVPTTSSAAVTAAGLSAGLSAAAAAAGGSPYGGGQHHHQGSVCMVYGLCPEKMNAARIFNLFCLYGNVVRVKFLKTKEGCAMVQMGDGLAVERVVANLNNSTFYSSKMQLGFSKQAFLADVQSPYQLTDGSPSFQDFMGSKNNRFINPEMASKNRIQPPSKILHFFNTPPGLESSDIESVFVSSQAPRPKCVKMFPSKTERSSSGLIEFETLSDSLEALVACNHHPIPNPSGKFPYIMKLCFSSSRSIPAAIR